MVSGGSIQIVRRRMGAQHALGVGAETEIALSSRNSDVRRRGCGTKALSEDCCLVLTLYREVSMGRGILLWLLGIPIPIIILIMLFAR